ncbi:hypothetical protein MRS_005 [Staphylococcus phage MR003]|nr:hypothetical protein [Staphylococcus phage vB_SauM-V1SA20]BBI90122.1 hypothetical protein MRS_005 [Staphylococcus phage MR003]
MLILSWFIIGIYLACLVTITLFSIKDRDIIPATLGIVALIIVIILISTKVLNM